MLQVVGAGGLRRRPGFRAWVPLFVLLAGCFDFDSLAARGDASVDDAGDASETLDADGVPDGEVDGGDTLFVPSYVPAEHRGLLYAPDTGNVTVAASETWTFNTETGVVMNGDEEVRGGDVAEGAIAGGVGFVEAEQGGDAPGLGIFFAATFTVAEGGTMRFEGENAFVLLAQGNVTISGTVDAGAHGAVAGPGGRSGVSSPDENFARAPQDGAATVPQAGNANVAGGAGGGGNGGAGGSGGDGKKSMPELTEPGGSGGELIPHEAGLIGGGGGGVGFMCRSGADCADDLRQFNAGGGGGGAIQFSSAGLLEVQASAVVTAPGGGATTASGDTTFFGAGAGGGAGGMIVLEGQSVSIAGHVTAGGGGGGGGDRDGETNAEPGARGLTGSVGPAQGSAAVGSGRPGNGGAGGAGGTLGGGDGESAIGAGNGAGGGGGGAVGRIVVRSEADPQLAAGDRFSPARGTSAFVELGE